MWGAMKYFTRARLFESLQAVSTELYFFETIELVPKLVVVLDVCALVFMAYPAVGGRSTTP